jgi:hypothetical protein
MKLIFLMIIGVNMVFANLVRSGDIVTDTLTNLQWQDNETNGNLSAGTWESALEQCELLNLNVNTDWRLPNVRELKSITDKARVAPAMNLSATTFAFVQFSGVPYWSASTVEGSETRAWVVSFDNGGSNSSLKGTTNNIRCVRDSE